MWYCIGYLTAATKGCELVEPFVGEPFGETAASDAPAVTDSKIVVKRNKTVNLAPSRLKERLRVRFFLTLVTNI